MIKNKKRIVFENVYDLLKGLCLPKNNKNDSDWEELSRKFFKQAKKDLKKFIQHKNIELDMDHNFILIGKSFKITLQ